MNERVTGVMSLGFSGTYGAANVRRNLNSIAIRRVAGFYMYHMQPQKESGGNCVMRSFVICMPCQKVLG
jgi:hypothetical protein